MAYTYTSINGERVQTDVAAAFNRLNSAFKSRFGLSLVITSGTRTTAEQRQIFLSRFRPQASGGGPFNDVRWYNGTRYVRWSSAGTVAVPGSSNHEESGPIGPRALDIRDTGGDSGVTVSGTARANWIRNNASSYGFKPAGYAFSEPWHIEYSGSFGGGSGSGSGGGSSAGWPAYERYGAAWVTEIQKKLNRLGYSLDVDGKDGPSTQKAVSEFQSKSGLTADGIAGPDTNAKLDAALALGKIVVDGQWGRATTIALQRALGVNADGEVGPATISALQTKLKALGHKIDVDGQMGPATIKALQTFTMGASKADGLMGPATITALQIYLNAGGKFLPSNTTPPTPTPPTLTVDGEWGPATTKAFQKNLGVTVDGEMGPATWKAFQKASGQVQDGEPGPNTYKALQMNVGANVDGQLGPESIKKLQTFLNSNGKFKVVKVEETAPQPSYPKPERPTFPGATYWNHSPNSSPRRSGDKIQYFVVHHAADTSSVENQINRFMRANDRNVSPNWLVGKDGSISEIVPPDKFRAWTSGEFDYKAVTVETQNTSGSPDWGISEDAHKAIARLVAWASKRYGFPIDREHVIGHREIPGAATVCPGPSMDLDWIVKHALELSAPTEPIDPVEPEKPVDPTPTPEMWTITIPKSDATELGKLLDSLRGLLP